MRSKVHQSVICTGCGCLCDDITVEVMDDEIVKLAKACPLGRSKFLGHKSDRLTKPLIRRSEELVQSTLEEAIQRSIEILADSRYPLLYGWAATSCEAMKAGIELAEEIGGIVDNASTHCHGPYLLSLHDVGVSTCTLGQVKNRADLIIYWGCNPVQAHPYHIRRYSIHSRGAFREGRKDRTLIVVDVRETFTARLADLFIRIDPGADFELLTALRMLVKDEEIEQDMVSGISISRLEEIADMLLSCEFGVLFFGLGLTMSPGKSRNVDAALSLVRDLNDRTKFVIIPMRGHFNVTGVNMTSVWETGYPFAVDFSRGYPRYNPGETSAVDVMMRGDIDATLVVAADPIAHLPQRAIRNLVRNPIIAIDPRRTMTTMAAHVVIPSAMMGVEVDGTAYRMDGVPLYVKKLIEPPQGCLSDVELIRMITEGIRRRRR
ncbi:MAG: formylmethanofuran dehydrogenase subunit B [Candidatus Bathyarchaeia archaeon]